MSRINFESFQSDIPALSKVWHELALWVSEHPDITFLDPRRLSIELSTVAPFDLARALMAMQERGAVRRTYMVRDPEGRLLAEEYDDYDKIPPALPDRLAHFFEVEPSNVVPVYQMEKASN